MTYEEVYRQEAIHKMEEAGIPLPAKDILTCYGCPAADKCPFAWDPYNTDGDCLADK